MPTSSKPRRRPVKRMQRPPSARQVCATFAPIFGFLAALRTGEIWCTDSGAAIMPVWGGELCEAGPALDGWISCWQRIVDGERLEIDLQPLRTLHAKLEQGEMLTIDLVDHCRQVTYACRKAYGRMPRARAKSYSLTELIAVEVEECGLVAGHEAGILDPRNRCVDPNADTIEHHQDAAAGLDAKQASPLADWNEDV